jgi:tetratricopeptide (TPR) repeat protein
MAGWTPRSTRTGVRSRSIPGHANAHNNLGVLLRATGRPVEAEAAYREAIRLNPEHIDAYTNLGILLNALKRTEEAAACYCKVITLRPKYREARKLLALAHCTLGEIGKAAQIFEQWLAEEPGGSDCAAHAGGVHGPGCAGTRIRRLRGGDLRWFFRQLRSEARGPVLSCTGARRGHAGGMRASRLRGVSTCWMRGCGTGGCAARWSRRLRAGWSAWIFPTGCWGMPGPKPSTTRWSEPR